MSPAFHETVWPLKILKYLVSALFIGILEEFIFRGLLFRTLEKGLGLVFALVLTNGIYSLSHFLRYSGEVESVSPSFLTSLQVYRDTLVPFTQLDQVWPGAISLFLFGMVLSYAYLRTGYNLIFPIALHAGSVFFLKLNRWFIHIESEAHKIWFGGTDLHASVFGWIFILLIPLAIRYLIKSKGVPKGYGKA